MAKLSLSKAWDESKGIFARDGKLLIAVALALFVLPQVIVGVAGLANNGPGFASLIAGLIGLLGQLALVRLIIGPSTSVAEAIRHGAGRFLPTLGAFVLIVVVIILLCVPPIMLAAMGGMPVPAPGEKPGGAILGLALALVILSVLISIRFMMTVPVGSAEQAGPVGILKRSWALTRGHYWRLLALALLLMILALVVLLVAQSLGGIAASLSGDIGPWTLGALILALAVSLAQAAFTILSSLMLSRIYVQLASADHASTSVPSSRD